MFFFTSDCIFLEINIIDEKINEISNALIELAGDPLETLKWTIME